MEQETNWFNQRSNLLDPLARGEGGLSPLARTGTEPTSQVGGGLSPLAKGVA